MKSHLFGVGVGVGIGYNLIQTIQNRLLNRPKFFYYFQIIHDRSSRPFYDNYSIYILIFFHVLYLSKLVSKLRI